MNDKPRARLYLCTACGYYFVAIEEWKSTCPECIEWQVCEVGRLQEMIAKALADEDPPIED